MTTPDPQATPFTPEDPVKVTVPEVPSADFSIPDAPAVEAAAEIPVPEVPTFEPAAEIPIILFVKALVFGGIEEIGWRYFFQPTLQEKLTYIVSTLCTFVAWSLWHLLYFYIDGSLAMVNLLPFLLGLFSNCFILSAIYTKTRSLWLCVMTHALINALSQLSSTEENLGLSLVIKVLIILLAMRIASSSMEKAKS